MKPDSSVIQTFPYKGERQFIRYTTKEFSAVCPGTGLPDIATVEIEYIPNKRCLELKSLKYYFFSYRNVGIYQEDATNRIFRDIHRILKPRFLSIRTIYNTRGGIDSVCLIKKGRA
ncbi:MAG: preQ(1) synthase [Planctomycetota bacterium]